MGDVGKMGKGKSSFIGKLLVNYDATMMTLCGNYTRTIAKSCETVRTLCVTFVTIFSGAL